MENYVINDKLDFARYIATLHRNNKENNISPIKLQKSLYFLYAYWLKLVGSKNEQHSEVDDSDQYSEYLFNANFRAWKYGPVEFDVYKLYKQMNSLIEFDNHEEFKNFEIKLDSSVRDFVNELSSDLFDTNDFVLVDLSHEDSSWKNAFDSSVQKSDNKITHESIKEDYVY